MWRKEAIEHSIVVQEIFQHFVLFRRKAWCRMFRFVGFLLMELVILLACAEVMCACTLSSVIGNGSADCS